MKIGIVIAIERELKSFLQSEYEIEELQFRNTKYFKTNINGNDVFALKSGWGIIDATSATSFLINHCEVDIIINFGVTGALDPALKVSDLFVVEKCLHYDFDVSPIDPVVKHQYEEFKDEYIPLDKGLIDFARQTEPSLKLAVDCSGDQFVEAREEKIARFNKGCNICDMEIAGIARTCYLHDVKCLSIKCISDTFDGDGGDFNTNVRNSSDKAFKIMIKILKELK